MTISIARLFLMQKDLEEIMHLQIILSPLESKSLLTRDILRTRWPVMNLNPKKQGKNLQHNKQSLKGNYNVVYKFNENVLHGETDVKIER